MQSSREREVVKRGGEGLGRGCFLPMTIVSVEFETEMFFDDVLKVSSVALTIRFIVETMSSGHFALM